MKKQVERYHFNMLKFYIATLIIDGRLTLEEGELILKELGNKKLPDSLLEIVVELKKYIK